MPWPSVRASTIPRTSPTAGATFSESSRSDPAPFQGSPYGSLRHSTHSPLRIGRVACAGSARVATKRPRRPSPFPPRGGPQMTRASVRLGLLAAATLVFWSVLPGSAPAQTVAYSSARRDFAVGLHPRSVATGDFNGDGVPDLAVASQFWCCPVKPGTFSVLLGNSDGTFRAATIFASGSNPRAVALGDFNADGKLDLVVADGMGSAVWVLLGNGDGTFQTAVTYAAGDSPYAVVVGDFNADSKLDLVVAVGSAGVSVLLGNGDGTFQPPLTFGAGSGASASDSSVAVGDFNADGRLDLAVANSDSNNVSVLLGNGDGTFQAPLTFGAGSGASSVAVSDFNGDGKLDLVVTVGSAGVSVLLGNGDGTFQAAVNYATGSSPYAVAVGDFNADGKVDLAIANGDAADVSVLLGNGDGTFQTTALTFSTGTWPSSVAVGDFNADGRLDLAVANFGAASVSVLLGNPSAVLGGADGTFQAAPTYAAGTNPLAVTEGDFNRDGVPDLAVADSGSGTVSVLLGNDDGTFQTALAFPAGNGPESVAVGDFNGDGELDLAVTNPGSATVSVLLGNGDGTFQAPLTFGAGSGASSVALGDLNADGKLDLVVANRGFSTVSVLLGNGDGTFQAPLTLSVSRAQAVAVGDFNRDGVPDLAVANRNSGDIGRDTVSVLLGNGDGTFQAPAFFAVGGGAASVVVDDFNGDGVPDLALASPGYTTHHESYSLVSVLLGNGDGTFQAARTFYAGGIPSSVAAGDFNGDGKVDLAVATSGSNALSVLLGNGDGTFQALQIFGAGSGPVSVASGDFNRDGVPDLAVANFYSNNVSVLVGRKTNDLTTTGTTPETGSGSPTSM
ncbi:MAG: VCBS repeat-containing protein [Candidatus Rokuibacteriota bacterium]|nr:MAG: VCBS repeat-containing protein [Candidatus Rokubacteria bacterium]